MKRVFRFCLLACIPLFIFACSRSEKHRKKAEMLYNSMSEENKTTPTGYQITALQPSVVEIGENMVDADLFDINGNTKCISDYSGKYIFLNFWKSGCGYCIAGLSELKEISESYCENLTVISIGLDIDFKWKETMVKYEMPWINLRDSKGYDGLIANYAVRTSTYQRAYGIPFNVILSPEGKVIDKWMGYGSGYYKRKVSENIK